MLSPRLRPIICPKTEGLVDCLVVKLDDETKEYLVEVRFQLPIVKDQLFYRDETE